MKKIITIMAIASLSVGANAQTQLSAGIDMNNLDTSARPGESFYQYACGGWMKNNPLPAAYSRFGSFDQLAQDNNKRINSILTDLLTKSCTAGTVEQKLGDFYKLAMDSTRRNKEGVKPVMPMIQEIEKAKTKDELFAIQLKHLKYGNQQFIGCYLGADEKDSKNNILNVYQSGTVLSQKEYYLDNDDATVKIREAYRQHIVNMFRLFGFKEKVAQKKMEQIMEAETTLAKVKKSQTELRDVEANYNKITLDRFETDYPHLKLSRQLQAMGIDLATCKELVIGQPEFLSGADKLAAGISLDAMKAYMEWGIMVTAASYLSDDVVEEKFNFFGRVMSGRKENHPRWKQATLQVEDQMGEALGKIYAERYFPASSKERMEKLVANLQKSLAERIQEQSWMSEETKAAALDKLNSFYVKIGYPNQWKDMSGLTINPQQSYWENVLTCMTYWTKYDIDRKAGKPVDRDEWFMTPQTVNAYYNPTTNEICFPAGILQVPFFDPNADDAFNYGAIGVVIGHEMTHGFDDQGRHYDKFGNMTDWWTEEDGKNFNERAETCVDFFAAINVLPDLKANGKLTLGENLADHGGLQVSFNAYKNATKESDLPVIDGLTADQRFFLAYAGVWAANITEAEIRNRTKSDPHSLGKWRVDGALPHIDAWYEAFDIKEGDSMYLPKEQRVNLW